MKQFILLLLTLFLCTVSSFSQPAADTNNSATIIVDSLSRDTSALTQILPVKNYQSTLNELLKKNSLIRFNADPINIMISKKQPQGKESLFYLLSGLLLVFGFFKVFYARYFNNIFRVFFNTSLRQNQLTDILLQARLPSLIFNIFFIVAGGLYVWLLLHSYNLVKDEANEKILIFCILVMGIIYVAKFCIMKFIGWLTGMKNAIDTYIFVIFLINKILGIVLIPFIILLAFSAPSLYIAVDIVSFLVIGIFFLLRFFRSYSLLQYELSINLSHLVFYILGIEILPFFIIYKWLLNFLSKG